MANGSMTGEIARSSARLDRPSISAQLLQPFTRQLFQECGLKPGMRVLDVCSGAGDVALLAREFVGRNGEVIGFDPSAQSVAYASDRASFHGLSNVKFVEAQIEALPFGADFDAVVGRVVLTYRSDPIADLRALASCVRPGGLLALQEFDHLAGRTIPPAPLIEKVRRWFVSAFERAGIDVQMGVKLYAAFEAAALPPPRMRLDALIGGPASTAPMLMASVVSMLLPQLQDLGVAPPDEGPVEELEERMRLDLAQSGAVMQGSLLISAWSRLPS